MISIILIVWLSLGARIAVRARTPEKPLMTTCRHASRSHMFVLISLRWSPQSWPCKVSTLQGLILCPDLHTCWKLAASYHTTCSTWHSSCITRRCIRFSVPRIMYHKECTLHCVAVLVRLAFCVLLIPCHQENVPDQVSRFLPCHTILHVTGTL